MSWSITLRNAQVGDEQAMAELYRAHQGAVLRYLRVCDPDAAEDIASTAWMQAARSLRTFSGDELAFRSWLFTIVRRRLIDHQRATARFRAQSTSHRAPATSEGADERHANESAALAAALVVRKTLVAAQAEVVLLRCVAGLTVTEVAVVVGKTETAVRILQHRGLRRLAQIYTPQSFSEEVKHLDVSKRSS